MQQVVRPKVQVERTEAPKKRAVKLLMDLRPEAQKNRGPGPSKAMYRLTRIWKKTWVRRASLIVLPGILVVMAGWKLLNSPDLHAFIGKQRDAIIAVLAQRPEFAVNGYRIEGASAGLESRLTGMISVPGGASTMTFDVAALQADLADVAAVKDVSVALGPKGILHIDVIERVAEALWRDTDGALWLIDREGVVLDPTPVRADWPKLPVVIGEGAGEVVAQALSLFRSFPDLKPRLRAFVRVGERRWNVELDRGLTIMLPEQAPKAALARVMAWHYGDEVLDRGLVAVDMRLPDRPTLRMNGKAHEILRLRDAVDGAGEET
ncbi:MAG: cell division protein FtsQ/DivIB [Pseudomonadota bacterium]